ncbi:ankyrin repeat domain-containing protein [Brachyspira intermedia]|uniref:ankyrin repeat domain-containing protein n=1 Tax=Brachyspira intermedia TaxID=84377 RepID=UPI00300693DD
MRYLSFILIFLNTFFALFAQMPNTGRLDQLLDYANAGDTNGIKRLISQGPISSFIDYGDSQGHNALITAASKGYKDIVLLLLSQNANVNLTCIHGKTALTYAADAGYVDIVSYLLAKNANPNIKINSGTTALLQAAGKGYYSIVEMIVNANADLKMMGTYRSGNDDGINYNMTPLMVASYNNHDLIVRLLLDKGSDINYINEYGANALFYAIGRGNNDIARLLLERGADANIVATYGPYGNITPLALASTLGLTDVISSLLIGKSDINFKMRDGRTALIWAAIAGKSEAVNSLIMNKANLNIADNDGKTALMFAAENGDYASVEYLINAGAHLNTLDKFKKTALMYAMENGNTEVIDLLTRASLTYNK